MPSKPASAALLHRFAEIGHHLLDVIERHCAWNRRWRLAELIHV